MDENLFYSLISSSAIISGNFDFKLRNDYLMDMDINDKKFINCNFTNGDFASGTFLNCSFDKVVFKNTSLVGVLFDRCIFINCKFINIDYGISMNNCEIQKLVLTREGL